MPFPQRLIDGYRAFLDSRLRHEQDRYRELGEKRAVAGSNW
jgi:carbonic anhydrase